MQFIVTGTFNYTAKRFVNGAVTKEEVVGNISEIVDASSEEAATQVANQIFANYERQYGAVADRRITAVASKEAPAVEVDADEAQPQTIVAVGSVEKETGRVVCRKCGVVGFVGLGYPFSTLPASSCLCDDCGA